MLWADNSPPDRSVELLQRGEVAAVDGDLLAPLHGPAPPSPNDVHAAIAAGFAVTIPNTSSITSSVRSVAPCWATTSARAADPVRSRKSLSSSRRSRVSSISFGVVILNAA